MGIVRAYHGTTLEAAELIRDVGHMRVTENAHDWLGPGAYFFQEAPYKAWKWAQQKTLEISNSSGKKIEPAVVGVDISLERCFDLLDIHNWREIYQAYQILDKKNALRFQKPPILTRWDGIRRYIFDSEPTADRSGANFRDNIVVKYLMETIKENTDYDTTMIRAAFIEGKEIYENSYFFDEYHVQICLFGEHNSEILIDAVDGDLFNPEILTAAKF